MLDAKEDTRCDWHHGQRTRRRCPECPHERRKRLEAEHGLYLEIPAFLRGRRTGDAKPGGPTERCCEE